MAQQRTEFGEAFVTRKVVSNIKPSNALGVEGMGSGHQNVWIIKSAEMKFDNRPQLTTIALPGKRCPAVATICANCILR